MKTENIKKLENLFGEIYRSTNGNSVDDYINISDIDIENFDFSDFCDELRENNFFDIDIVYYYSAIEYLKENDPSLHESLEIAEEYGYRPASLSSEILASLLASRNFENEFYEYESEICDLIDEILEDEQNG